MRSLFFSLYFLLISLFSTSIFALNKETQIYAHRGGRAIYPENTLEAYRYSTHVGVDFIDMDVGVSKDGVVVVTHNRFLDPNIVQTPQGKFLEYSEDERENYLIKNLTSFELKQFRVGRLNPESAYARLFPLQKQLDNVTMPTLEEVIDTINQLSHGKMKYQIEMKTHPLYPNDTVPPAEFAQKVYAILEKKHIIDSAEVQSFDWRCLYALQELDPRVHTAYLTSLQRSGELKSAEQNVRTLWTGGKDIVDYNQCTPCMIASLGGKVWGPEDLEVTPENIKLAQNLGLKVVSWSSPERVGTTFPEELNKNLISWGVDGIISDDPARLKALLAR